MAHGPNLGNWHQPRDQRANYYVKSVNQSRARARWGGRSCSETAAQLNRGERNLNPKHPWTRAEWAGNTHFKQTPTQKHTLSVSETVSRSVRCRGLGVLSSWSGAAQDAQLSKVRTVRHRSSGKTQRGAVRRLYLNVCGKLKGARYFSIFSSWLSYFCCTDGMVLFNRIIAPVNSRFLTEAVTPAAPPGSVVPP